MENEIEDLQKTQRKKKCLNHCKYVGYKSLNREARTKMCGAYGFSIKNAKDVYDRFEVVNTLAAYKPRWNVRIGQMAPVIYMTADGVQIKEMYWSFIPSWGREKRLKFSTFNARDDRLLFMQRLILLLFCLPRALYQ